MLCFTLYSRVNSKYKPPGGLYLGGDLTEGFLCYDFGGLVFSEFYVSYLAVIDTRHLCTRLRTDGIKKAMSRGFSGGKQVIKSANNRNRSRVCLFWKTKNEELFYIKDDNGKLWVEVIIVTFLDAIATVDVLTPASKNDVKHIEILQDLKCRFVLRE